MTTSPGASVHPLPAFIFNLRDIAAAARLQQNLTWHGYRVAIHQPGDTDNPAAEARDCDAVLFASTTPVHDPTSEVRRCFPRTRVVTTVVVDGAVIVQPFEAVPQRSVREGRRIRDVAAAVRTAQQVA